MTQANIATVQSKGDIVTIVNAVAADVNWHSGGSVSDFPTFGPRRGLNEVQGFFKTVAENLDFAHFSPREFHASGDKVFVLGDYAMTLKKTGKKFESDWVHVFTFHNGKVTHFREFLDTAKAREAHRG